MLSNSKLNRILSISILSTLCFSGANAQLSTNPDKFLGNITTRYNVDAGGGVPEYYKLWNQITPENESKWGSVEGTRGSYNWGSDKPFDYAKSHGFTYKFHALVWGAQYPEKWFTSSLPVKERYNAIVKWFDEVKKHYPDLPMIDVVNEAVGMHQQGNPLMKESLGGGGKTGYDWLIKAFELAHERWPNAILIYNDFNTFQGGSETQAYIDLVRTLRDAGAPIDAYGCQSHDVNSISKADLQSRMKQIQDAVKIPMYITELDINVEDDDQQKAQYQSIFPLMWEADYCAGVTIWGYIYGATWVDHSGLYRDGVERPAMTWLKSYMASDAAKNAKSPFPGGKKQISLYIKPATLTATRDDTLNITVRATLIDKTRNIDSIKLYINDKLDTIMTDAPYVAKYVPTTKGNYSLKAVVYADSVTYEREGSFTAYNPRSTYKTMSIPGTIQAEDFDKGDEGVTYHDSKSGADGDLVVNYRSDNQDVDIVNGNGGKAIGYTSTDEWLEYTVNVTKAGFYTYEAVVSSGTTNSGFRLSLSDDNGLTDLSDKIVVPQTASNDWGTYTTMSGRTLIALTEGKHIFRLTITGSSCNIDKITFKHVEIDNTLNLNIAANPTTGTVNQNTSLTFTPVNSTRADAISSIKVFVNGTLKSTLKTKPFQYTYKPAAKGTDVITAIAVDTISHESEIAKLSHKVNNQRTPYSSAISIPGVLQAENFDKGGEGLTFHDSDSDDEGKANYRNDNEGVDIASENNGYVIGYTRETGEWLEYTVNVKTQGKYAIKATVCSGLDNSKFRIGLMKNNSETTLANVSVRNDGWGNYYTTNEINLSQELLEGQQIIRITVTGVYCNIDKIQFILKQSTSVNYILQDDAVANGTRYNLGGAIVGDDYKGIKIINGKKVLQK